MILVSLLRTCRFRTPYVLRRSCYIWIVNHLNFYLKLICWYQLILLIRLLLCIAISAALQNITSAMFPVQYVF